MSAVYGFLAGAGFCAALVGLIWAARRDQAQRRRIEQLTAEVARGTARLEAEMAMRADLANDALAGRDRHIEQLQAQLAELQPSTRHDRLTRVHRDIGEADLFAFTRIRDELLAGAKIANHFARRAEFVANGGRPDDFPQGGRHGVANGHAAASDGA